ncbi:MAG TPA: PAS domain S-box protein, partial [Thermoanaerobaculia bacterium]
MTAQIMEDAVDETALLRAESATLRQLLQVLERTAIEQTKRIRAQLEFTSAITQSMGEGVLALDRDGRISFVNRAAEELLGRSANELTGATLDLAARSVRESLRSRRIVRTEEDVLTRADGTKLYVTTTVSPIVTGGEITGAIIVVHDITGRKLLVDAGAALATSFDYEKTLERVARLAIPAFADWAFVHLIESDGSVRR